MKREATSHDVTLHHVDAHMSNCRVLFGGVEIYFY